MRSGPLRSRLGTGLRWAAAIPLVAVAACAPPPVDDDPAELTPRAVAAIALAHLPTDTVRRMAAPVGEVTPEGMVGADLRYADDQLVRVTVTPADSPGIDAAGLLTCDRPLLDNCADLGHDTTLRWQPDAEPGRYSLTRLVDGELLHAASIGPAVAEDPRLLEVSPSVEQLRRILMDPALRLTTTVDADSAGEALADWDGEQPEPDGLKRVPQTGVGAAARWMSGFGEDFTVVGRSPVAGRLGPRAIGGRLRVGPEIRASGPRTVDVLVSPTAPAWVDGRCLPGFRCHRYLGTDFALRPATGDRPGEAWLVHTRADGATAAIHVVDPRLTEHWHRAVKTAGVRLWLPRLKAPGELTGLTMTTSARLRSETADLVARHSRARGNQGPGSRRGPGQKQGPDQKQGPGDKQGPRNKQGQSIKQPPRRPEQP